jgi:hypothetical protein
MASSCWVLACCDYSTVVDPCLHQRASPVPCNPPPSRACIPAMRGCNSNLAHVKALLHPVLYLCCAGALRRAAATGSAGSLGDEQQHRNRCSPTCDKSNHWTLVAQRFRASIHIHRSSVCALELWHNPKLATIAAPVCATPSPDWSYYKPAPMMSGSRAYRRRVSSI